MSTEKAATEIGARFRILREALGLKQIPFAESLGVSQNHISQIENSKTNASELLIQQVCMRWVVRKEWLLTGHGDMFEEVESPFPPEKPRDRGAVGASPKIRRKISFLPGVLGDPAGPYQATGFVGELPPADSAPSARYNRVTELSLYLDLEKRISRLEGAVNLLAQALKVELQ